MRRRPSCFMIVFVLLLSGLASAQTDVSGASRAYEEGLKAQLKRDYQKAAMLFELADSSMPSAQALRSAIRTNEAAGNRARAATLAAAAKDRYPNDAETCKLADAVLHRAAGTLVKVQVHCDGSCALAPAISIDGRAVSGDKFFVTPGEHELVATFADGRKASRIFVAELGPPLELAVAAPPPVVAPAPASLDPVPAFAAVPDASAKKKLAVVPPVVFTVGLLLTAGAGAAAVWSGLDTLSARDAYKANPTKETYDAGVQKQTLTNVLIGTTAGLGAVTVVIAAFTDWKGGFAGGKNTVKKASARATLHPAVDGNHERVVLGVGGSF